MQKFCLSAHTLQHTQSRALHDDWLRPCGTRWAACRVARAVTCTMRMISMMAGTMRTRAHGTNTTIPSPQRRR